MIGKLTGTLGDKNPPQVLVECNGVGYEVEVNTGVLGAQTPLGERLVLFTHLVTREDGSYLVAGWMPVDEFCDRLGLPREMAGEYDTVAGLVLHQLGQIPDLGAHFTAEGFRFEVIDLDGRRIDKVLVARAGG